MLTSYLNSEKYSETNTGFRNSTVQRFTSYVDAEEIVVLAVIISICNIRIRYKLNSKIQHNKNYFSILLYAIC